MEKIHPHPIVKEKPVYKKVVKKQSSFMNGGFGRDRKDSFYQNSNLNETADFDAKFQIDINSDNDQNRGITNPKLFNNGNTNTHTNEQSSPTFNANDNYTKTPYIGNN